LGGRKGIWPVKKTKWWGSGVVIRLERGADLPMAQLMPLPLTASFFSKIQIVLPFWYWLTWVVPDKGPLNGCMYVWSTHRHLFNGPFSGTTPLRELTCHMGSQSVTCQPAEVTFPPLPQPKLVLDLVSLEE